MNKALRLTKMFLTLCVLVYKAQPSGFSKGKPAFSSGSSLGHTIESFQGRRPGKAGNVGKDI